MTKIEEQEKIIKAQLDEIERLDAAIAVKDSIIEMQAKHLALYDLMIAQSERNNK